MVTGFYKAMCAEQARHLEVPLDAVQLHSAVLQEQSGGWDTHMAVP